MFSNLPPYIALALVATTFTQALPRSTLPASHFKRGSLDHFCKQSVQNELPGIANLLPFVAASSHCSGSNLVVVCKQQTGCSVGGCSFNVEDTTVPCGKSFVFTLCYLMSSSWLQQ